jgi:hypothetical protein
MQNSEFAALLTHSRRQSIDIFELSLDPSNNKTIDQIHRSGKGGTFKMPMVTRTFSLTNFVIASSALCFQVFVLYPWHKELDEGFAEMRREHARILQNGQREMERELSGIRRELQALRETGQGKK